MGPDNEGRHLCHSDRQCRPGTYSILTSNAPGQCNIMPFTIISPSPWSGSHITVAQISVAQRTIVQSARMSREQTWQSAEKVGSVGCCWLAAIGKLRFSLQTSRRIVKGKTCVAIFVPERERSWHGRVLRSCWHAACSFRRPPMPRLFHAFNRTTSNGCYVLLKKRSNSGRGTD